MPCGNCSPPSNLEWGQSVQLLAVTQTWIPRWWGPTEQKKGLGSSAHSRAAPGRGQELLHPTLEAAVDPLEHPCQPLFYPGSPQLPPTAFPFG